MPNSSFHLAKDRSYHFATPFFNQKARDQTVTTWRYYEGKQRLTPWINRLDFGMNTFELSMA